MDVRDGERWVVLGRIRRRKDHSAAGRVRSDAPDERFPPTCWASRMGRVDVFELRPRASACRARRSRDRIPAGETVRDVVLTAAYGVTGRWRESYESLDESRAADLLAAFGVAHLADRYFGTLSEGSRKRVQIARSLMTDPELLLLDEPAAAWTWAAARSWSPRCRSWPATASRSPCWCSSRTTSRRYRRVHAHPAAPRGQGVSRRDRSTRC